MEARRGDVGDEAVEVARAVAGVAAVLGRAGDGERGNERMVRHIPGSTEPPQPQASVTCNAGVKRKLGEAFEFLEGLSAENKCNEHVYNEMSKQLRNVYTACNGNEDSAA